MRVILLALLIMFLGTFCACSERWEGFVYPNAEDLTNHRYVGEFDSLEECRDACRAELSRIGAYNKGDYECGKNCKSDSNWPDSRICEETAS